MYNDIQVDKSLRLRLGAVTYSHCICDVLRQVQSPIANQLMLESIVTFPALLSFPGAKVLEMRQHQDSGSCFRSPNFGQLGIQLHLYLYSFT
jgi:hypothetical protein